MKNKFESSDLVYLIEKYKNSSPGIKGGILEVCILNIEDICNNQLKLFYGLLYKIMGNTEVDDNFKKSILYYNIDSLNVRQIKDCMTSANLIDFVILFEGKRPKILVTEENQKLLTYFKEKDWIAKFDIDSRESQYYRVIGKKYIERQNTEVAIESL